MREAPNIGYQPQYRKLLTLLVMYSSPGKADRLIFFIYCRDFLVNPDRVQSIELGS